MTVFPHPSGFYLECRCGGWEKFVPARSADEQIAGKPSALDLAGQHDGRDHSWDLTHPAPAFYAEVDPEDLDDHGTARIRIRTMEIDGEVEIIGYPADDDPEIADANMHRQLRAAGYTIIDSGIVNPVNRRTITYPVALAYPTIVTEGEATSHDRCMNCGDPVVLSVHGDLVTEGGNVNCHDDGPGAAWYPHEVRES